MTAHLERARLLIGEGRWELAEKEVGLELAGDPNHALAHVFMAYCLAHREEYEKAGDHASQAVALSPDVAFTHHCMAKILVLSNRLDEGEAAIREAIRLDTRDPDYHELLGRVEILRSRWQPALEAAEEALALDPEHVDAKNLRAEALLGMERAAPARDELDVALQADPEDAPNRAKLGWTMLEKGEPNEAMSHFRDALRIDPGLARARAGVVEALKALNPFYRFVLQCSFWMGRVSTVAQWALILGACALYALLPRIAETVPEVAPWVVPLLAAYIVFVLGTWLAAPLSNLALTLHPVGRLALSRDDRGAANWIGAFLLGTILAGIGRLIAPGVFLEQLLCFFLLMLLPLGATFRTVVPWPRSGMVVCTILVGALGVVVLARAALPVPDPDVVSPHVAILRFGLELATLAFPMGAILSIFLGSVLASIRRQR